MAVNVYFRKKMIEINNESFHFWKLEKGKNKNEASTKKAKVNTYISKVNAMKYKKQYKREIFIDCIIIYI